MTKRTQKQRISYAEVDSDHDWPSSDDEGEVGARAGTSKGGKGKAGGRGRGRGDSSYGSALPLKKKARRAKNDGAGQEKGRRKMFNARGEPVYNEDLLLQLPFDMLAEVGSHLDTRDLITLARVSRALRKLLLSPATRSLWAVKRHQTGYELPRDMDDIAFALLMRGRRCNVPRSLSSFTRSSTMTGFVLKFERFSFIHKRRCASRITTNLDRIEQHKQKLENSQWDYATAWEKTRDITHHDDLRQNHEFTDDQISFYASRGRRWIQGVNPPRNPPAEIPAEWKRYRLEIQALLDKEAETRRAEPGRAARTDYLQDRFDDVKSLLSNELGGVFPTFERFKNLDNIKQLWFPVTAQIDDSTWPEQLPVVQSSLRSFAEQARVQAARVILAATEGVRLMSLSEDPADYPASEYGDAFFNRITSSFLTEANPRHVDQLQRQRLAFRPFPECIAGFSDYGLMRDHLECSTSGKQVYAIRFVVEAAGLDIETATVKEMDALGVAFKWPTCPTRSDRNRKTWIDMVPLVERLGPGITKLRAGARVKLQFFPPDAKDVKGKGKAAQDDPNSEDEGDA
ncbi:hypothetical protein JCM6882_001377 [Rhodosporidiobolus microsporus]